MADAANGYDELARLTLKGAVFLKNASGSTPSINSVGEICYSLATYDKKGNTTGFDLVVRNSFTGPGHVVYRQKDAITGNSWGPDMSIGVLSGTHYPGTNGPTPKVLTVSKSGQIKTIHTQLGSSLSSLTWNEEHGGIAVSAWQNKGEVGEVIYSGSRHYSLPPGWSPAAWNATGTELLAWGPGPGQIGLWSSANPHSIKVIGALAKKLHIGEFVWLASPAKL